LSSLGAIPAITLLLAVHLCAVSAATGQQPGPPSTEPWTGSAEQKLWGLMTVWAEAKYAFPHFDQRPGLDWDATARAFIPRVLSAEDMESYYLILQELVALLEDSHTMIVPPWGYFKPGYDLPPFEVGVVEGRFMVTRTGDAGEIDALDIYPGLELLEVDGVPARRHFEETVLKYRTRGSVQGNEAVLPIYLLYGPAGTTATLKVRDTGGASRDITVTRNSAGRDGAPFLYRFVEQMFTPAIDTRRLGNGLVCVSVPNFENEQVSNGFLALVDSLEGTDTTGMIIDLRANLGGSSAVGNAMTAALIDEPVMSPLMRYRPYAAAEKAWGRDTEPRVVQSEIKPREGFRFTGHLVLLTDGATNSSAEDFVIELQQTGRALVVGGRTCGGAGNTLDVPLPGGGMFRVSTFSAAFPDGREFAGIGIEPDVEVHPSREDLLAGRDAVFERGLLALLEATSSDRPS
jgi:C-terminal processing protease CtpA/Prc